MGSVAASVLIVMVSFLISFTMIYSATMDAQSDLERAIESREELNKNYYFSSIDILECKHLGGNTWSVVVLNDGKVNLNPYYLSLVVNGTYASIDNILVEGKETTVWIPGEIANITFTYGGNVERVLIYTQYGSSDFFTG